jgi:HPt (histidine-containing phosphotransfer) domain-containing protein
VNDDTALIFISDTLSYILTQKDRYAAAKPTAAFDANADEYAGAAANPIAASNPTAPTAFDRPDADIFPAVYTFEKAGPTAFDRPDAGKSYLPAIDAARLIDGLNIERGISLVDGAQEQYQQLLRLSAKVLATSAEKLRGMLGTDIRAFATEIHGTKGALYSIGADSIADLAAGLERAAKFGDTAYCEEHFPSFEKRLYAFSHGLALIFRADEGGGAAGVREPGDPDKLFDALWGAKAACERYDGLFALDILSPFAQCTYGGAIDASLQALINALETIDYDESAVHFAELERLLLETDVLRDAEREGRMSGAADLSRTPDGAADPEREARISDSADLSRAPEGAASPSPILRRGGAPL